MKQEGWTVFLSLFFSVSSLSDALEYSKSPARKESSMDSPLIGPSISSIDRGELGSWSMWVSPRNDSFLLSGRGF